MDQGFSIIRLLSPPVFPGDAAKTRKAALLSAVLMSALVLCVLLVAGNLLGGRIPQAVIALNGVMIVLSLIEIGLLHKGYVTLSASMLIGSFWLMVTLSCASLGTVRAPAAAYYIVLVLLASLLFSVRGLFTTVLLSSVSVALLVILERHQILPAPDHTVTITQWITYSGAFIFSAAMMSYTLGALRAAVERADREVAERVRLEQIANMRSSLLEFAFSHTTPEVLRFVLDQSESLTASRIGFFHFCEGDDLSLQMWSTRTLKEFCTTSEFEAHYPLPKAGIWADCVRERRAIICNDYPAAPNRKGIPEGHADVTRFLTVPVFRGEKIVAVVGVGNKETDYVESDLQGLTRLADLCWDIVELKRAQASVHEANSRLHQAMEFLPVPVGIADRQGRVFYYNREFTARFGYTVEDVKDLDRWFQAAYPDPEYRKEVLARWSQDMAAALETGRATAPHVYELTCKDGTKKQVQIVGRPAGELLIGYFADLTETLQADKERENLEERLHQAEKMESLGVLAGGIAHDFNNLLGGVFGFIELARSADPGPRAAGYLERASGTMERARDLTRQLLTFSRGGAPARQTQSLTPVIREAAQFALSGSNVSLTLDMPQDLWLCDFDKNQLAQVADNLVINACQAMPNGGSLSISAANETLGPGNEAGLPEGRYVRVSFADTGPGIAPDDLPRVFDPFFTTKKKGHGLGLATAHSIVRRHEGAMKVESTQGRGSTFHVYLRQSTGAPAPLRVNDPPSFQSGGRVLIMDDEDFIRDMACDMLKEIGYEGASAKNGEEAIDMIGRAQESGRPFAAVIMDLTIPGGMGGRDAVRMLPASQNQIVAIVASGYSEDPVMAEPGKFGFNDKLEKPFRKAELARVLGRHLSHPVSAPATT